MIECRCRPGRRAVAQGAIGRETRCDVIRVRGSRKIRLVAAVTVSRQRQVVVVHVTSRASHGRMRSRQRKRRGVVIEGGACPVGRGVARCARRREAHCRMGRSIRSGVIRLMAGITICGHGCVVVIRMALRAS